MPTSPKHEAQAQHNELFKARISKKIEEDFSDWEITVMFYAGLHHIRTFLSAEDPDWQARRVTHTEIEKELEQRAIMDSAKFDVLANSFKDLKSYSQDARYNCLPPRRHLDRMSECEVNLRRIREGVAKLLSP